MPPKPAKKPLADKGATTSTKKPAAESEKKRKASKGEVVNPKCRKGLNIPKKLAGAPKTSVDVNLVMQWALMGKTDCDYPETSKIVRIFTSSTFTDTRAERNALMARVYPKLREYCRERGYDFQVVDMRWGVRDESTDDHLTSELCMRELQKCQRLSTGPNFITFLAQKYGYRPFPAKIGAIEFEKILAGVSNKADKTLLTDWFVRDDNIKPPVYQLTPIRQKLPDYANDEDHEKKKKARAEWWEKFEKMQVILREASSKQLDVKTSHKYYWAVTEEEIHNGILSVDNVDTACYWFRRSLDGLAKNTQDKTARRYMDIGYDGKTDEEALNFLTKLKDEKLTSKLSADNITDYSVGWTENGVDVAAKEHEDYIDVFCSDFDEVLRSMIDNGIELKSKQEIKDSLALETMAHAQFAQHKCAIFHGRKDFLELLKAKVADKSNRSPVIICGEPGAGKTSVVAKVASLLPDWCGALNPHVILRFLGTTTESSTTKDLLRSLCTQIHTINQTKERIGQIPMTMKELKEHFCSLLEQQSSPLVILLDSLDQLRDFGSNLRDWIPQSSTQHVTIILSCIPAEEFVVGPELKKYLPKECFFDLPNFTPNDIDEVLKAWLEKSGRALQGPQNDLLVAACKACALPLFAKMSYDSATRWRSYQPVKECILGKAVEDSIELLFGRVEKYHGEVLVRHALGYVTAAKSGLSTNEIEDILSIDDVVLNDVYQYHTPPLRRLPPLIWVRIQDELDQYLITAGADGAQVVTWYHRQFHTIARRRYFTKDARSVLCNSISEYFRGLWAEGRTKDYTDRNGNQGTSDRLVPAMPYRYKAVGEGQSQFNLRKLAELSHALTLGGDVNALKEHAFFNFDFLYYKLKALSLDSILDDLAFAKVNEVQDAEIDLLCTCLEMSREALSFSEDLLPSCLLGRLGQKERGHPAIAKLLDQAARPTFDCLYSSQGSMNVGGGVQRGKFVGHSDRIQGMALSKDEKFLVSSSGDGTIRVWDVHGIKEQKAIDMAVSESIVNPAFIPITKLVNGDKWVACISNTTLALYDLETGLFLHRVDLKIDGDHDFMTKGAADWSEEHQRLFVMQYMTIDVWDIVDCVKVDFIKIGPRKEPDNPNPINRGVMDFIASYKKDIVYYKAHSNVVNFVRYGTKKKTDSYALHPEKDIADRHFRFAVLSTGYLLCYNIRVPHKQVEFTDAILDVINIATAKRHCCFMNIDMGYFMVLEQVLATGPDTFVITNHPTGTTVYQVGNIKTKTLTKVLTLHAVYPSKMISTQTNQVIAIYMTNMSVMEFLDISSALDKAESGSGDDFEVPEIYVIKGQLPGNPRYYYCTTNKLAIGIWDAYERRCVRVIETDCKSFHSCVVDPSTAVSTNPQSGLLYHIDMAKGKILLKADKTFFPVIDNMIKLYLSHSGHVVMIGPNATSVCGMDLKTGKVAWTIEGGSENLGALIVSENGQVAVCETAVKPGVMPSPNKTESTIHVFNLKAKKKLPALKFKPTRMPARTMVEMSKMCCLTPDGEHFCIAIMDDKYEYFVFTTRDGKSRQIKLDDFTMGFVYSRQLKSLVMALQNGQFAICPLKDLKITRFKVPKPQAFQIQCISNDGNYVAICDTMAKNVLYVIDVVKQCTFASYVADNEVAGTCFSHDNHFLFVAGRTNPGLSQLCMYEASKGQTPLGGESTSGGANGATGGRQNKEDAKPAAKGKKNDKNKSKKVAEPEIAKTDLTLEKRYLEMLAGEKNIYGPPKAINLKEA